MDNAQWTMHNGQLTMHNGQLIITTVILSADGARSCHLERSRRAVILKLIEGCHQRH